MNWNVDDEFHAATANYGPNEPLWTAQMFIGGVSEGDPNVEAVVTPESRAAWGDFSAIRRTFDAIPDMGFGSYPVPADGAPDIAYVKIIRGVRDSYISRSSAPIDLAGVLTMVWRPERGIWMIHSYGPSCPPEDVPRTSPGIAPDYTHAP